MAVLLKSAFDKPGSRDGLRVLVERSWPKRLDKKSARVDLWLPALAATNELALWMKTYPKERALYRRRYFAEVNTPAGIAALEKLHQKASRRTIVTLLFSGTREEVSAASLLRDLLEGKGKPPSSSGPGGATASRARAVRKQKP